ncbi:MAG TPA: DUF4097 family beta strand repeat-containing protein [Thermoanaerobaculia bacterium]|nr:DUF4097 family beta strand repeat-containing protein [Thermoanaerobaculia bacterium]
MNDPTRRSPPRAHRLLAAAAVALLTTPFASAQGGREQSASIRPGGLVELDLDTGAGVEITAGGGGLVTVRSEIGADSDPVDIQVTETSRGVRISCEARDRRRSHRSHVKLFVEVPRQVDIELESMGGSVTIDGVDGAISGETMGGALRLSNLRGELHLSTMGGDIELVDSEVDGKVSTMGGEVLLRDVVGDVDGTSMGGNVRLVNVTRSNGRSTGDAVIITTMGGKIDVDEAPAGAKLETMGGNVRVARAEQYVDARTMGGDVLVEEVAGWIEATTMGGDIEAHVVEGGYTDYHVELTSMSGEIVVTLPSGVGFTFDVELEYTRNRDGQYRIDSDFPLQIDESADWSPRGRGDTPRKVITGRGQVGDGAHLVKLSTINGKITIRRR